jgi:hypothetical protein
MKKIAWLLVCLTQAVAQAGSSPVQFQARDFGAVGDGKADDRPALQAALDSAATSRVPARVHLEPGRIYRLAPYTNSIAALSLVAATNVTVSGHGATLVASPQNRILSVYASERVVLQDVLLDYDPLPYTQGRIIDVMEDGVLFSPDPGYPLPVVADEKQYRDQKDSDCVFINGQTRLFNHEWRRIREVKAEGNGSFAVYFHGARVRKLEKTKPGDYIAIKICQPRMPMPRASNGRFIAVGSSSIQIRFSQDIRLEHVTSYASPSMTVVTTGSENVELKGLRIIRKPGTDRLVASCSDGAHMKSLTQMPRFLDCHFEALMDDSINIKVSGEVVKKVEGNTATLTHLDILYDDIVMKPGDVVDWVNEARTTYLGESRVVAVQTPSYRLAQVTFDQIPATVKPSDTCFLRPQSVALVSNCVFKTQLKTALLTRPPTRVTGSIFDDVAYGVHAFFNTDCIEGPIPRDIAIERCTFARPSIAGVALYVKDFAVVPPKAEAIRIADCSFMLEGKGSAVRGRYPNVHTTNLQIRGTTPTNLWMQVITR